MDGLCRTLGATDQLADIDAQSPRQFLKVDKGDVTLPSFGGTDVGSVKAGAKGELFL